MSNRIAALALAVLGAVLLGVLATTPGSAAASSQECGGSYVVQEGDSLTSIAEQFDTTVDAILACNPDIEDPDFIFAGQELAIPGPGSGDEISTLVPISKSEDEALAPSFVPSDLMPVPSELVSPGLGPQRLRSDARFWMQRMFEDAGDAGHTLGLNSGYRSYAEQEETFQFWVDQLGEEQAELVSARPGRSEHQLGTAADITGPTNGYQVTEDFADTPEGMWLRANGWRYGFALSYPEGKTEVTGYLFEPWHWRFIGLAHAEAWLDSGLTLIEYLRSVGSHVQGDVDCDGDVDAVDALNVLSEVAAIDEGDCAPNGDLDCNRDRSATDALGLLRHIAALPPIQVDVPCPGIGELL